MTDDTSPVLDDVRLESLVDEIGDRDLVHQAIQAFIEEIPDRLASIRVALVDGDPAQIKSAAHALGSPASMLGAVQVAASSRALQNAMTEGRIQDAPAMVDDIIAATGRTERAMRDYLGS